MIFIAYRKDPFKIENKDVAGTPYHSTTSLIHEHLTKPEAHELLGLHYKRSTPFLEFLWRWPTGLHRSKNNTWEVVVPPYSPRTLILWDMNQAYS